VKDEMELHTKKTRGRQSTIKHTNPLAKVASWICIGKKSNGIQCHLANVIW